MAVKNSIAPVALATFDTATLTGNYQLVSAAGLPRACFFLRLINSSNVDVIISYDGVTDHDVILGQSINPYPFQSLGQPQNNVALIPRGTKIWVKQRTAAGAGSFSIAGYYQI